MINDLVHMNMDLQVNLPEESHQRMEDMQVCNYFVMVEFHCHNMLMM